LTGVAEISASLVKELRDATGAGMMDCKRALVETGGDLEAARTLLREKGMAAAGKRADRATTEGLVGVVVEPGKASIVGLGCETEPVSKNDEFQEFATPSVASLLAEARKYHLGLVLAHGGELEAGEEAEGQEQVLEEANPV